ncbi:MAG: hypothetical protein M3Y56_16785, partial [Armatimonadota bacterium]|nr:hypothetical protein [Armatimonadota bacterium]
PAPRNIEPGTPLPSSLPDLHSAGLTLDILKPANTWEDRVLQYALSYWEDRERIYFKTETWGNLQAWRVVPNPVYRDELAATLKKT